MRIALSTLIVLAATLTTPAHAETGFAVTCVKPGLTSGTKVAPTTGTRSCDGFEVYRRPLPGSLVRSAGPTETKSWGANFAWRTFKDLPDTNIIPTCTTNVKSRSKLPASTVWTAKNDPCKAWADIKKSEVLYVLAEGPGPVKLSWQAVDKNVDDSNISDDDKKLLKYIVMGGIRGQPLTPLWSGTALKVDILLPKVGDNCYNVYAETTVRSEPSAMACKNVVFPAPTDGKIEGPTDGAIETR